MPSLDHLLEVPDDYNNIEDHLQRMAFAWNSTISESLSVSPFEIMTGTQARSIPDSAMRTESESSGLDADAIRAIKDAVAEYTLVARKHADSGIGLGLVGLG